MRRRALLAAGGALLAAPLAAPRLARAAGYPDRAIRIVVPYAPGGSTDAAARYVAAAMSQRLGQSVVIDNRAGATGTIGAGEVARAAPDGYTVLVDAFAHASNPALFHNLPFDYRRSFLPVTQLTVSPQILCVHPSRPVHSLADLVALAKREPGKLSYGSPGNASAGHLAAAALAFAAKIEVEQVAYRGGGPAIQDLLANNLGFAFGSVSATLQLVKENRLRPLAVSRIHRIAPLPDLPAVAELGYPGFDINEWSGLYLPAGTPPEIVAKLGDAARAALAEPAVRERIEATGTEIIGSSTPDFAAWLTKQREDMAALIRDAKITAD